MLASALFQSHDKVQLLANLGLLEISSLDEVHTEVKQRMEIIGPLAREVLGPADRYEWWKAAMEGVSETAEFLNMQESTNMFALPRTSKYYLAPDEHGQLRFLSGHVIERVLQSAKEVHRQRVAQLGYAWQTAEYIVKEFCVMNGVRNGTTVCDAWNYNKWEYFNNPAPDESLSRKHALDRDKKAEIIAKITKHTHEATFDGSLLRMRFDQLDPLCVYSSSVHTMSLGEFFVVCVNGEMILFKTSTMDPSKHAFNLARLLKWAAAVKPKSITIIYFTDWCERGTSRMTVKDKEVTLSDSQVSERLFGNGNQHSFKSYIVRCGIYNLVKPYRYILSGDATKLGELVDMYVQVGEDQVSSSLFCEAPFLVLNVYALLRLCSKFYKADPLPRSM